MPAVGLTACGTVAPWEIILSTAGVSASSPAHVRRESPVSLQRLAFTGRTGEIMAEMTVEYHSETKYQPL